MQMRKVVGLVVFLLGMSFGFSPANDADAQRSRTTKNTKAKQKGKSQLKPSTRATTRLSTLNATTNRKRLPRKLISSLLKPEARKEAKITNVAIGNGLSANLRRKVNITIDVGGEGRYVGAINLNPMNTTSTTGAPNRPIPNHVEGIGEKMPFRSKVADKIIIEGAPIRPNTPQEIARVVKSGGVIQLLHPSAYATKAHKEVIDATGGTHTQSTKDGLTTTIITVPK